MSATTGSNPCPAHLRRDHGVHGRSSGPHCDDLLEPRDRRGDPRGTNALRRVRVAGVDGRGLHQASPREFGTRCDVDHAHESSCKCDALFRRACARCRRQPGCKHSRGNSGAPFATNVSFSLNVQLYLLGRLRGRRLSRCQGNPTGGLILAPGFAYAQIVGMAAGEGCRAGAGWRSAQLHQPRRYDRKLPLPKDQS